MTKTYVLYHANCFDGLGAKFAAWKKFHDSAIYIPVNYSEPLPEIESGPDTHVYILDFSYPRNVLEELRRRVGRLVVLDHHKTAEEALRGFPGAKFDMNKSGAVLAWEYFHPRKGIPQLLLNVQDRDLWRFQLPGTKEITRAIPLLKGEMAEWDKAAYNTSLLSRKGRGLLDDDNMKVESFAKTGSSKVKIIDLRLPEDPSASYTVALYNTTELISEIGNAICKNTEITVNFSLSYFLTSDGKWVFSFRSTDDMGDIDVSAIAKKLGGGGHKNAAGATLDFCSGAALLNNLYNLEQPCHLKTNDAYVNAILNCNRTSPDASDKISTDPLHSSTTIETTCRPVGILKTIQSWLKSLLPGSSNKE